MPSYELTNSDYEKILKYYNKTIPSDISKLKKEGENILSLKLCQCIKKINPILTKGNEPKAIGICSRSVVNNKGLVRGKFKCLKKRSISVKKKHRGSLNINSKNSKNRKTRKQRK